MIITPSKAGLALVVGAFIVLLLVGCDSDSTGPDIDDGVTDSVWDIDGNMYQTIRIGDHWWMAENLKVTLYRDSTPIPHVTEDMAWRDVTSGAYCNYGNDTANGSTYGLLYNWYAVDDSRGLAPEGWHVATDADWQQLESELGMSAEDTAKYGFRDTRNDDRDRTFKRIGDLLKSTDGWIHNGSGSDSVHFSALPSGYRYHAGHYIGLYVGLGSDALFWTSAGYRNIDAWYRWLTHVESKVGRFYYYKGMGLSVRCVKD